MTPPGTALLAGGSLVAGFAVAQVTGVRALGGLVLLVAVAVCAVQWRSHAGVVPAVALTAAYAGLFVGAHLLAGVLGAWPSVVLVAVVMAAASLLTTCWSVLVPGRSS